MDFSGLLQVPVDPGFPRPPPPQLDTGHIVPVAFADQVRSKLPKKSVRKAAFLEEVGRMRLRHTRPDLFPERVTQDLNTYGFAIVDSLKKENQTKACDFIEINMQL